MRNDIIYYFLLFLIFPFQKCENEDINRTIIVSQTILQQAIYYEEYNSTIIDTFVDFNSLKFYKINMETIHHKGGDMMIFEFFFNEDDLLNIQCKTDESPGIICNKIYLEEHNSYSFFFDYKIAEYGGIISFILILFGFLFLLQGYIYYNLTIVFYSSFCIFLFWREFFECMEILQILNTENEKSQTFCFTCFVISIFSSIAYGYVNLLFKFLRYFSLGIIEGIILGKFLFFFILLLLKDEEEIELKLFITEISCAFVFMVSWILLKDKYPKVTMVRLSLIASFGITFGLNVLFGGYPYMPFLILAKKYQDEDDESNTLFKRLSGRNNLRIYLGLYALFSIVGCYFNINNTKTFMEKARKKISIY